MRFPPETKQKMAKQKSTPDQFLGGLSRVNPNLTHAKNRSGVDFCFWVFLTGDMKYPRYWSTLGRFQLEKTQKTAKQKSTPDQFLGGLSRVNPNLTQPKNRSGVDFH